jgi:hypothetical protein
MDELDVEASRLEPRSRDGGERGAPADGGDLLAIQLLSSNDSGSGQLPTPQRRIWRIAAACALLLLLLALLALAEGTAVESILSHLAPTATSGRSLASGGRIFFQHSVPWGILRIDHDQGPDLDAAPRLLPDGQPVLPYSDLPPGRHLIQYDAQFFAHFECVLHVPSQPDDTCQMLPIPDVVPIPDAVGGILDLRATVNHLEPGQFAALAAATESALMAATPAVILAPGERYRNSDGRVVIAQEHLYAELLTTLKNVDLARAVATGTSCVSLCDVGGIFGDTTDPAWRLHAHVVASWRYRRLGPSGPADVVANQAPAGEVADDAHVLATIKVEWAERWLVTPMPGVSCQIEEQLFQRLMAANTAQVPGFNWPSYPDQTGTACLFIGTGDYNEHATPDHVTLYVLYRFGALVAANDEAQRLFPELPVATAEDAALAQQIAASATGTRS